MNLDTFTNQIDRMHKRLDVLYKNTTIVEQTPSQLLPVALKELGIVAEELQVALEELQQKNEELQVAKLALEVQQRHYQQLFDFAPEAYLVIDTEGIIIEANCAAAELFNVLQHLLVGKPLVVFVIQEQQQKFYQLLTQLQQGEETQQECTIRLLPRNLPPVDVRLAVAKVSDEQGNLVELRICLRNISDVKWQSQSSQLAQTTRQGNGSPSSSERLKQTFLKGEIIPLSPQTIWQVSKGMVKLSTICETSEEVLVGLVSSDMLFGADLTALPIYQATALTEVQAVSFSFADTLGDPHLAGSVLTQISQRLRQTEKLLAISGQRRTHERFYQLLQLMQQEIGQPVELGTRLSIRFTHQDFASACCTTRVSITRLVGKLQNQGKITFDGKNHLIVISQERQRLVVNK